MEMGISQIIIKCNDEESIELKLVNLKTNAFYKFLLKPLNFLCSVELKSYSYRNKECGLTLKKKFLGFMNMENIDFVQYSTDKNLQKAADIFSWFIKHYDKERNVFILPQSLGIETKINSPYAVQGELYGQG